MSVFINQVGYMTDRKKLAVITIPCESFSVMGIGGEAVYTGEVKHFGFDEASGDDVYTADFSEFNESGEFCIVAGGERSYNFRIEKNIYSDIMKALVKSYYYMRCGCELETEYAGKFTHSACHLGNALVWETGEEINGICGGWHDAGDYGRYATAGAVALAHLLYAYKLFPKTLGGLSVNIPESGDKLPDILAECKYELDWIMKMQRDDGAVYHKLTTAFHAPFVMPEYDTNQLYLLPVSSMAAADLAAVCALASVIYRDFDEEYADRLLSAAKRSGEWLIENPAFIGFSNPDGCSTGGYGERDDKDNRFWAYTELYFATGDRKYHELLLKQLESCDFSLNWLGYADVGGLGGMAYIFGENAEKDAEICEKLKNEFLSSAKWHKQIADSCGYGVAMESYEYNWGSNMTLMEKAMIFAIADIISGNDCYKSYVHSHFDCLLGKNALGRSYVTSFGTDFVRNLHYRPMAADGIDEPIEGIVSGGPNRNPVEPESHRFLPKGTPSMKSHIDKTEFYSLNENTIYWNSPTIFALAYLVS